jgi:hypothetical protein
MGPACQRVMWRCCTHRVRAGYLIHAPVANDISRRRGRVSQPTGPVKFVVEALRRLDWTWKTHRRKTGPFAHIRAHLWWESRWSRRLLVVTGARCPLTKPVVIAVELRVDHRAPLQPRRAARRYLRIGGTPRADSRRSGVGRAGGAGAASASYASCRSDSIYIKAPALYKHL